MYENTIDWTEYKVNLRNLEIELLNEQLKNTIGDWLKYHRKLENISQLTLATNIGLKHNNLIKNIENNYTYPNKEISIKLAKYFKLNTKYFYDEFLEKTENLPVLLYEYRKNNNLKIKDASKLINVSPGTWSCWEKNKYEITRENYSKLKELKIL